MSANYSEEDNGKPIILSQRNLQKQGLEDKYGIV